MTLYYVLKKNTQNVMNLKDGKCPVINIELLPEELRTAHLQNEIDLGENITYIYDMPKIYSYLYNFARKANIVTKEKDIYALLEVLQKSHYVDESGYTIEPINTNHDYDSLMNEMVKQF